MDSSFDGSVALLESSQVYVHGIPRVAYYLQMSTINIFLLLGCIAYMSTNMVLFVLNNVNVDDANGHGYPCGWQMFHNIEFVGSFLFNCLNQCIVVYSPEKSHGGGILRLLKWIALINILSSSISMMFVVIDLDNYEVPSHEMDYMNNLLLSIFDAFILAGRSDQSRAEWRKSVVLSVLVVCVGILQPCVYNGEGFDHEGYPKGETDAHQVEFCFEVLSAFISARIIYDNKIKCDDILREHSPFCAEMGAIVRGELYEAKGVVPLGASCDDCH